MKFKLKRILLVVLAVVFVIESCSILTKKGGSSGPQLDVELNLSLEGVGDSIGKNIGASLSGVISGAMNGAIPENGVTGMVKSVVYSDLIVNTVMSMAYPLLYKVLTDLELMDFATFMDLYATGPLLASKLEGTSYTCCDKDGSRKPLTEVLQNVGDDWTYMDEKVSWKDGDGNEKNTTLWNSIEWGVTDEASFYKAMNDMGEGLRGCLEVTLQGKERVINVNVLDVLLKFDKIPINIDAATVFNASGAGGYELCMIPLFNSLGLDDGDYPSVADFNGYTSIGDIWKGLFAPLMTVVEKAEKDPVNSLTSMLVNFANLVDSGKLKENMETLRLDAEYNKLAALVMGFSDGLIFNLGDALIEIVESAGLNLSGSFNDLLDSLITVLTKKEGDLPDMDVAALTACAQTKTLANGNTVYVADADKTIEFLVNYIMDEKIVAAIIDATSLAGTPEGEAIVSSVEKSKDGLRQLVNTIVPMVLKKLQSAA